jgi:hypothetical protein
MLHGSLDLETCRFRPGLMAPPPVCAAWCGSDGEEWIATWFDIEAAVRRIFDSADYVYGVNIAFDFSVLLQWKPALSDLIWQAYEDGRILDLGIIERMGQIATGQPQQDNSLGMLSKRYGLQLLDKSETSVRTFYGALFGLPLECYSQAHIDYVLQDVRNGLKIFERQQERYGSRGNRAARVPMSTVQCETYDKLWTQLISCTGLRTDQLAFDELSTAAHARLDDLTDHARNAGFVRDEGTVNKLAIMIKVCEAYAELMQQDLFDAAEAPAGTDPIDAIKELLKDPDVIASLHAAGVPMTEAARGREEKQEARRKELEEQIRTGDAKQAKRAAGYLAKLGPFIPKISTAKVTLQESGDPLLEMLASWGEARSLVNKDLVLLRSGLTVPIHSRFGLADTLRTTTSKPNIQNFGRSGGARECITARHGAMPGVVVRPRQWDRLMQIYEEVRRAA